MLSTPNRQYIPWVTNIVADSLSRSECDQSVNSRTINVHVKNKALAKCLRCYVKATSDYPGAMQTYDSTVLAGTITTVHALHREYKCNHLLVTGAFEIEKPVYVDDTARQQEIASRRCLFANTPAERERMKYIQ